MHAWPKKKVRKRCSSPPSSPWSKYIRTKVFEREWRYVRDLLWRSRTRITGIVPDRQDENEMTPVIAMRKSKGDTERKIPLISSGRRCIIDRTGRTYPARQSDSKILKSYFHTSVCNCIKSKSLSAERTWSCHPNQYLRLH